MSRLLSQLFGLFFLLLTSWGAFADQPILYTVVGPQGQAVLRWVSATPTCPEVVWDRQAPSRMTLRAGIEDVPMRSGMQADQKSAKFDLSACEAVWPQGVQSARVGNTVAKAPKEKFQRILIIADTGCRMKASENAFQDCNDASAWPFANIIQSAALKKPDLVVHIGDIHYRESPCPADRAGCRNSPWGYGSDTWQAEFFTPAKALLQTAPWLFVRGNHESCARAGQGWFRYMDPSPWRSERSCDLPDNDLNADYSRPYALPINGHSQFVIFDSSATAGKSLSPDSLMFNNYQRQWRDVTQLAGAKEHSIFLSHHPLLAIAPSKTKSEPKAGGNRGLLSVLTDVQQDRAWFEKISFLMHGHIHAFEALNFKSDHPSSFVLGNAGSMMEGVLPERLPSDFEVAPHVVVESFTSQPGYGFALLEVSDQANAPWTLTEFDVQGRALHVCTLRNHKSSCAAP